VDIQDKENAMRQGFVSIVAMVVVAVLVLVAGVGVASAVPATTGDIFNIVFSGSPGYTGSFALGKNLPSTPFFFVESFSASFTAAPFFPFALFDSEALNLFGFALFSGSGDSGFLGFGGSNWALSGVVGGGYTGGSGPTYIGVQAVPEPSTLLLLGSGLAAVGSVTWRWRHRRPA
jgi:PEP-CTERM motif-containing protein